jgi:hypothetical protein
MYEEEDRSNLNGDSARFGAFSHLSLGSSPSYFDNQENYHSGAPCLNRAEAKRLITKAGVP